MKIQDKTENVIDKVHRGVESGYIKQPCSADMAEYEEDIAG